MTIACLAVDTDGTRVGYGIMRRTRPCIAWSPPALAAHWWRLFPGPRGVNKDRLVQHIALSARGICNLDIIPHGGAKLFWTQLHTDLAAGLAPQHRSIDGQCQQAAANTTAHP